MKRIASNSAAAAAAGRSTLLLLLASLAAASRQDSVDNTTTNYYSHTSLGSDYLPSIGDNPEYNPIDPEHKVFLKALEVQREKTSASIIDFKFNEDRLRLLSKCVHMPKKNEGIIYWMNRDHRVQDNWALLYAQKLAIQNFVPLHVVYFRPDLKVKETTGYRQYLFMLEGLKKVELECRTLNIEFHFLVGNSMKTLTRFVKSSTIGGLVSDFSPLREDVNILNQLVNAIGGEIPVVLIDAHNVVPCWVSGDDELPTIESLRRKMSKNLVTYLTEFPPVIKHPHTAHRKARPMNRTELIDKDHCSSDETASNFTAGYIPGMNSLSNFLKKKLISYRVTRMMPLRDGLSNLSPWLHFGQISAQRVILEVMKFKHPYLRSVQAYKEEIVIKRELFENYCYYNSKYDKIEGGPLWGQETLNNHRNDTREHVYTREELEKGQTIDPLWNAAHNQMKREGKTHRFLRPYWAKKILEFSKTPEDALATANYFNNKFSLDGNDPCGFGGIMWSMTGLFDIRSKEEAIYGKIRSVSPESISHKFKIDVYTAMYQS